MGSLEHCCLCFAKGSQEEGCQCCRRGGAVLGRPRQFFGQHAARRDLLTLVHQERRGWDPGWGLGQLYFVQNLLAGSWGLIRGEITGYELMPGCRKGCVRTTSNGTKSQTFTCSFKEAVLSLPGLCQCFNV